MGQPRSSYAFTKLVVHDLEKMAAFYSQVYGLREVARVQEQIAGDAIDEIMLGVGAEMSPGSLVLLKFVHEPPPRNGEVILGFTTDDLPALLERVRAAGGGVHAPIRSMPEMKIQIAFATDPEGHLAELVQVSS